MSRKKGSKTEPAPIVNVEISACPKCGSTKRSSYSNTITKDIQGVLADGREYEKVIWRDCWCSDCGQHRKDRTYVCSTPKDKSE